MENNWGEGKIPLLRVQKKGKETDGKFETENGGGEKRVSAV